MKINEFHQHARMLYAAHGDKAEFEAAQNARKSLESGNEREAECSGCNKAATWAKRKLIGWAINEALEFRFQALTP